MKNQRKKAWKGVSGAINAAAELWKLAKLTFTWQSAGTLSIEGNEPPFALIDLDAGSETLSFKVVNKAGEQARLASMFQSVTVDGKELKVQLNLAETDLLFLDGTFQVWTKHPVESTELHLTFKPLKRVKKTRGNVTLARA